MGRTLFRLSLALVITFLILPSFGESSTLHAAPPLRWPFAPSADWRFLQGYNGSTHACEGSTCYQRYGVDLVREDDKTAGQPVYAMTTGEVAWTDSTHKCLSLDIGGGYFQITCHIDGIGKLTHGTMVKQGEQIGTVGPPAFDNGGMAHVHVGVYKAKNWQADPPEREPVPFTGVLGIEGANYPAMDTMSNQYVGTIVKSRMPVATAPLVPPLPRSAPTPGSSPLAAPLTINPGLGAPQTLATLPGGGSSGNTNSAALSTGSGGQTSGGQSTALALTGSGGQTTSGTTAATTSTGAGGQTSGGTSPGAARTAPDIPSGDVTVSVALTRGWNLLSVPLVPTDRSPASVLASIEGRYDVISTFDRGSGWSTYRPAQAAASDLDSINAGMGLWIRMTESATLSISGKPPTSTPISLAKGWNLVGYPSNRTRPVNEVFGSTEQIERVMTYRATDEAWYGYLPALDAAASDLDIAAPGRGYWVFATGDATLRIPW